MTKENDHLQAVFHRVWTRSVGTPEYVKEDWAELDRLIIALSHPKEPVSEKATTDLPSPTNVGSPEACPKCGGPLLADHACPPAWQKFETTMNVSFAVATEAPIWVIRGKWKGKRGYVRLPSLGGCLMVRHAPTWAATIASGLRKGATKVVRLWTNTERELSKARKKGVETTKWMYVAGVGGGGAGSGPTTEPLPSGTPGEEPPK